MTEQADKSRVRVRACLKIKLDPTIGIGIMHLNRKTVVLNR